MSVLGVLATGGATGVPTDWLLWLPVAEVAMRSPVALETAVRALPPEVRRQFLERVQDARSGPMAAATAAQLATTSEGGGALADGERTSFELQGTAAATALLRSHGRELEERRGAMERRATSQDDLAEERVRLAELLVGLQRSETGRDELLAEAMGLEQERIRLEALRRLLDAYDPAARSFEASCALEEAVALRARLEALAEESAAAEEGLLRLRSERQAVGEEAMAAAQRQVRAHERRGAAQDRAMNAAAACAEVAAARGALEREAARLEAERRHVVELATAARSRADALRRSLGELRQSAGASGLRGAEGEADALLALLPEADPGGGLAVRSGTGGGRRGGER